MRNSAGGYSLSRASQGVTSGAWLLLPSLQIRAANVTGHSALPMVMSCVVDILLCLLVDTLVLSNQSRTRDSDPLAISGSMPVMIVITHAGLGPTYRFVFVWCRGFRVGGTPTLALTSGEPGCPLCKLPRALQLLVSSKSNGVPRYLAAC